MLVAHHERKRLPTHFSMERLFIQVRASLPGDVRAESFQSPEANVGFYPRLKNIIAASRVRGDVHHVVGDVHYLVLGLPGSKTVLTIHDCSSLHRLSALKRWILKLFWYTLPARHVAAITTISHFARDELLTVLGSRGEKIRVIYNCVGDEFVYTPKSSLGAVPVVLQVGTALNKNLERVVQALEGLECELQVVGPIDRPVNSAALVGRHSGKEYPSLRDFLDSSGVAYRCLGILDDKELLSAYLQADVLAFVSTYEGFGLPVIEAQAVGRPIVASDKASIPEIAGAGAHFVDPYSVDEIRRGISQVLGDSKLRESLVTQGLENVKKFRSENVAKQYAEIYRELVDNGP